MLPWSNEKLLYLHKSAAVRISTTTCRGFIARLKLDAPSEYSSNRQGWWLLWYVLIHEVGENEEPVVNGILILKYQFK